MKARLGGHDITGASKSVARAKHLGTGACHFRGIGLAANGGLIQADRAEVMKPGRSFKVV